MQFEILADNSAYQNCRDFFPSGGVVIESTLIGFVFVADGGGVDCCFYVFSPYFGSFFLLMKRVDTRCLLAGDILYTVKRRTLCGKKHHQRCPLHSQDSRKLCLVMFESDAPDS
jgi:hypothetical protein